uniref:Uncharacterized protein n=1 Tax=Caulobacter phage BL57 TaxID=3348355 RepID=A0AB74UN62_9VIRU
MTYRTYDYDEYLSKAHMLDAVTMLRADIDNLDPRSSFVEARWKLLWKPNWCGRQGRFVMMTRRLEVPLPMYRPKGYRRAEVDWAIEQGYVLLKPMVTDEHGTVLEYQGEM